ncbi:aminoacyl-tRNA hydrolase [Falsarthrobacter nasiphocae]|uniref:Peptidyl-tRNA hydrolase n=1 Tax=Falsarthrobacter nasiphocae TaxID=189863 RepID=A0AAE3YDW4_9MICC|nr:aminoacyl-tRNA hydrolase [Falsarthrobacter nasiphocae]MDR6891584.1 PTH1 family peptidyl-tRNA hydrolase [Falsarthrobacter nasiphocae]
MSDAWLIAGLGNPGPDYEGTRHNVGQMVVDHLAGELGLSFSTHRARALTATGRLAIGGTRVVLAKPLSYMNVSGGPVSGVAKSLDIPLERIVVVHDELDIPFGSVRLKRGGGEGGHNGLRDITKALGTKDYHRVRVGIGRPPGRMDVADFVLKRFGTAERAELPFLVDDAADAVRALLELGLTDAQQKVHAPA